MKTFAPFALLALVTSSMHAASAPDFRDHLGLQLWSLRAQAKESVTGSLDLAKSYGIKEVETAGTGGLSVEQFAAELKSRGLVAVSGHAGYAVLQKDIGAAIKEAKALGAKFLICPYPKTDKDKVFSEEIAHQMAADF